jgi:hypothetical protein
MDRDIIGLNEVRDFYEPDPDYLAEAKILGELTGRNHFFAKAINMPGPYGNGFLCKYPIKACEVIPIPDPEVKDEDVYYETVRDTETRFFCINQVKKQEYLMDNPLIRTTGTIINIDGVCEEHYLFELYTDEEQDNIKNYLQLPTDTSIVELNIDSERALMVSRKINREDKRTDVIDFFVPDKVIPVFLDTIIEKYKALPDRKEYDPDDYRNLLPTLDSKKRIANYIYSSIVEFYSEYINENK